MSEKSNALQQVNEELIGCRRCPRLVAWRERMARQKRRAYLNWEYWGRPVPGFGDAEARLVMIGLAPGAHGSNRTGRMFTGDASGDFLYPALYRFAFANQPQATHREDGLKLQDAYITAVCRCVPPANKPEPEEIAHCLPYLARELEILRPRVLVTLGRIAFEQTLRLAGYAPAKLPFQHGAVYRLEGFLASPWLLASYHPSQQNTRTGRLNTEMFDAIWQIARRLLNENTHD
ncbi:MAG: uracil-DNA glycosylase [Anaerolineales bacterium]